MSKRQKILFSAFGVLILVATAIVLILTLPKKSDDKLPYSSVPGLNDKNFSKGRQYNDKEDIYFSSPSGIITYTSNVDNSIIATDDTFENQGLIQDFARNRDGVGFLVNEEGLYISTGEHTWSESIPLPIPKESGEHIWFDRSDRLWLISPLTQPMMIVKDQTQPLGYKAYAQPSAGQATGMLGFLEDSDNNIWLTMGNGILFARATDSNVYTFSIVNHAVWGTVLAYDIWEEGTKIYLVSGQEDTNKKLAWISRPEIENMGTVSVPIYWSTYTGDTVDPIFAFFKLWHLPNMDIIAAGDGIYSLKNNVLKKIYSIPKKDYAIIYIPGKVLNDKLWICWNDGNMVSIDYSGNTKVYDLGFDRDAGEVGLSLFKSGNNQLVFVTKRIVIVIKQ